MSLLLFSNPLPSFPSFSSPSFPSPLCSSSSTCLTILSVSSLQMRPMIVLRSKSLKGIQFHNPMICKRMGRVVVVKASLEIDGAGPAEDSEAPAPEKKEEAVVPVNKLPLESKLQEKMEQKMRMKMAKKIRLRRKRLVRKRRLRKKGRWPPSKMKKLKNV